MRVWKKLLYKEKIKPKESKGKGVNLKGETPQYFTASLEENQRILKQELFKTDDILFREIYLSNVKQKIRRLLIVYVESLVETIIINDNVIKPLTSFQAPEEQIPWEEDVSTYIGNKILNVKNYSQVSELEKAIKELLKGKSLLIIDGSKQVLSLDTQGWGERDVSNPSVERSVRGPQEAFMENAQVNLGLIRRRISSKDLKVMNFVKGKYTQTNLYILYIDGIANEDILKEVIKRVEQINVGQLNGCPHVFELIEDNPLSLFSTLFETERPDVVTSGLLEGRIAILTDGCPTALLIPKLFMENFISPEDYYFRFWFTFALRVLRFIAYFISTLLPGLYVAVISYHQELLPITLIRTVYTSREGMPFPVFLEMLFFLILFQILKESGATVPVSLATSITVVGTLILGQTAITAGFLSADGVIIGSITGIAIFLLPVLEFAHALFYLRFIYLFAGALGGFLGITLVTLIILAHLCSLRSFGVPYMTPLAPLKLQDLKDFFVRVPYLLMNTRPESLEGGNRVRQGNQPIKRYFFKYKIKAFEKSDEEDNS